MRLADVLVEMRRQLKPLQQQAEMARKHESLTAEAETLSRKLAAARLRALLREKDRRQGGWDEGLDKRTKARERLDSLDGDVLATADARATASRALADAEQAFRRSSFDRSQADQRFREAVERSGLGEAGARVAGDPFRALESIETDIARLDGELTAAIAELELRETELTEAEGAFRAAEEERGASMSSGAGSARTRRGAVLRSRRWNARSHPASGSATVSLPRSRRCGLGSRRPIEERGGLEAEIETFDDASAPMNEKRSQLEAERRRLVERIEELDDIRRRHENRRDLLEARRQDIEETAGSRFLKAHKGRAIGLLKDLVRAEEGLERALVAALGPLADAVVYDDGDRALADAPNGDGAILAIASGGPVPIGLAGERKLLPRSTPNRRPRHRHRRCCATCTSRPASTRLRTSRWPIPAPRS